MCCTISQPLDRKSKPCRAVPWRAVPKWHARIEIERTSRCPCDPASIWRHHGPLAQTRLPGEKKIRGRCDAGPRAARHQTTRTCDAVGMVDTSGRNRAGFRAILPPAHETRVCPARNEQTSRRPIASAAAVSTPKKGLRESSAFAPSNYTNAPACSQLSYCCHSPLRTTSCNARSLFPLPVYSVESYEDTTKRQAALDGECSH